MAEDLGLWIVLLQRLQQVPESGLLCLGPRVGRMSLPVQSPLIAHADGVLVIVAGMRARQVLVACLKELPVPCDVVMVACEPEAGIVTGDERRDRKGPVFARVRVLFNY